MVNILSENSASTGILSIQDWQPPLTSTSQTVETEKAEDKFLTEEYKAQHEVYTTPIEVTPLGIADFDGYLTSMYTEGEDPAVAANALADIALKTEEFNRLSAKGESLTFADIANASDPTVTANQFRMEHRASIAAEQLTALAESYTGGTMDSLVEAADEISYDLLQTFDPEDRIAAFQGEGSEISWKSEEWLNALTNMNDDEFNEFLNNKLIELQNPGLLEKSRTAWPVLRELAAMEAAGYIPWDKEEAFGGALIDLATLDFGTLATAGRKGLSVFSKLGKSAVYRARTSLGTEAATKVALRYMEDGVAATSKVADDIAPSALARPQRASAVAPATPIAKSSTPTPTVSQGALQSNWIYDLIKERNAKGAFGMAGLRDDATQWAVDRGNEIAKARSTNVIDFNVEEDGLIGTTATWTMGKAGGGGFTSFNNAKTIAAEIPNSKIVSLKTGLPVTKGIKGHTYAIQFAERRAYDQTPLQMSDVKDFGILSGFVKWFGSNGLASKELWNNLAYSADAGGAKLKHDLEPILKKFDTFDTQEQGAFSSIIQSIQDNGKQNKWLTEAEFTAQYVSLTGTAPRKEVIQVYENFVVASDASWFLAADRQLQQFAKNGFLVYTDKKGNEVLMYPYKAVDKIEGKVLNASTGAYVDKSALPQNAIVYKFYEGKKGTPRYVYNTVGKTRLPEHNDALRYNAGGPRPNPEEAYFAGTMNGSWKTLLGGKTNKQMVDTKKSYDAIQSTYKSIGKQVDPQDPTKGFSPAELKLLDDAVLANNKWNPNLETWDDFVRFINGRGIDLEDALVWKERNSRLEVFEEFDEDFVMYKNLGRYIQYSRHDEHLISYGGERAANPNPVQAVFAQFNRAMDQAARVQWEQTHVESWAKAVHDARDPAKASGEILQIEGYSPIFTGATLARNIKIIGKSPLARKLRQEQSTIVRRLRVLEGSTSENPMFRMARESATNAANWAMEAIYDSEWKWAEKLVIPALRGLRDNTSGMALSFSFMTKMATPIQFLLQGSSAIGISMRSKNGYKGAFLAGYVREMARHAQGPQLLTAMRKQLAKVAGLTDTQLNDLIDHFETSGRGFAKGAIIEDPDSLPGVVAAKTKAGKKAKQALQTVGEVARAPFYAGENFAQTVARITAYLDTVQKYPTLNTKSKEFWGAVTTRDRSLSLNLNPSSASMSQVDPTARVWVQFTSFFMRAFETVFFDKTLSLKERAMFASSLTVLWGYAGMGLPNSWFPQDEGGAYGTAMQVLKYGPIDYMLKEIAGITVGDRVALNIPSLLARVGLSASDPLESTPAVNIGVDATKSFMTGVSDLVNGRPMLSAYSLERLVRTFKIIDDPIMAYQMLMEDQRTTAKGHKLPANYTNTQAFFQAIGIRPIQVTEYNQLKYGDLATQNKRKFKAIDKAVPSIKLSIEYANKGDWESASYYMEEAASIIDAYGLSATYRAEAIQAALSQAGADEVSKTVLSAIRAGLGEQALDLQESLK